MKQPTVPGATAPGPEAFGATPISKWWVPVLVGVLSIIAGILALAWPGATLLLVGVTFGILLLFAGAGNLVSAFGGEDSSVFLSVIEAILGVLTLLAGLILLVRPGASVLTAAWVLGFWFVVSGVMQLARGFAVEESRWFDIIFGLIGVAAGVIILAEPRIGLGTLVWIAGFGFIFRGCMAIALGFAARKLSAGDHETAGAPRVVVA